MEIELWLGLIVSNASGYDMANQNPINYALIPLWQVTITELGLKSKLTLRV